MKVSEGDLVRLHYQAILEDGTVFDHSRPSEPIEFQVGTGQVISGIDEAVIGLEAGKHKITVEPTKAYGPRKDDLVQSVPIEILENTKVSTGEAVELESSDGTVVQALVVDINPEKVTFDLNHPLAGRTLTFEIDIVDIVRAA